jgi:uncharacterized protein (DUF58 family)
MVPLAADENLDNAIWLRLARGPATRVRQAFLAFALRSRTIVCREGVYYLLLLAFVFAGATLGDVNLLMLLAGMLVGPVWLSWRLVTKTLRGIQVRRHMPHGVCAGDLLVVKLELSNSRKRLGSWAVVVEEQVHREGDGRRGDVFRPTAFFSYVPARQTRERAYRGRLPHRGRYRFAVPTVSTRFPFGLFHRTIRAGTPDVLVVYPRLGRLTQRWLTRHREWFEGTHRREHRHGRVSGDFYGVRPWRSGDSRRFIHWRSSARHAALVVRQFEQHRNRDLAVLVDLWQPERPQPEDRENVELAVSFAATVVADACRRGGSSLFVSTSAEGSRDIRGPASALLVQNVMEQLAVAEASGNDRLPDLLQRAMAAVEPGTEVVLVTTRAIGVGDAQRLASPADDSHRRSLAPRIRVVNTADAGLNDYFQTED